MNEKNTYENYENIEKNNREYIQQIDPNDFYDCEDVLNFLNNEENFPSFSTGLTELLRRKIKEDELNDPLDDETKIINYLYEKMISISVNSISKNTIKNWVKKNHRPKPVSNSRTLMYQLCFALDLQIDEVKWFFQYVYFSRSFNCHRIDEAVYYYCFLHNSKNPNLKLSYNDAQSLIDDIGKVPKKEVEENIDTNITQKIQKEIETFSSLEELKNYLSNNKHLFDKWNISANKNIKKLLSNVCNREEDSQIIKNIRNNPQSDFEKDIKNCSFIIQSLYKDSGNNEMFLDNVKYKNIHSIDFILQNILYTKSGIQKASVPSFIKNNFPSKKVFSSLKNTLDTSTSYDTIRKMLIFLYFISFWDSKLRSSEEDKEELESERSKKFEKWYEEYIDHTNRFLFSCGYENLCTINPYDWLFMCFSKKNQPLKYLYDFTTDILDNEI